jgi:hypothetical protein
MENGSDHRAFTKQFKLDSVEYRSTHPELTTPEYARNLGVGRVTNMMKRSVRSPLGTICGRIL